jgi:hypothetical protein
MLIVNVLIKYFYIRRAVNMRILGQICPASISALILPPLLLHFPALQQYHFHPSKPDKRVNLSGTNSLDLVLMMPIQVKIPYNYMLG